MRMLSLLSQYWDEWRRLVASRNRGDNSAWSQLRWDEDSTSDILHQLEYERTQSLEEVLSSVYNLGHPEGISTERQPLFDLTMLQTPPMATLYPDLSHNAFGIDKSYLAGFEETYPNTVNESSASTFDLEAISGDAMTLSNGKDTSDLPPPIVYNPTPPLPRESIDGVSANDLFDQSYSYETPLLPHPSLLDAPTFQPLPPSSRPSSDIRYTGMNAVESSQTTKLHRPGNCLDHLAGRLRKRRRTSDSPGAPGPSNNKRANFR
jgi:hypothetical protein